MRPPKVPTFFKLGKQQPRSFSFTPRVYDERKERLDKRRKEIEEELRRERGDNIGEEAELEIRKEAFRSRLEESWRNRDTKPGGIGYGSRVFVILLALLAIVYLIFIRL